jgi:hypothetical protein
VIIKAGRLTEQLCWSELWTGFSARTSTKPTTTDDDPIAAAPSARPGHPVAELSRQRIKRRPVLGGLINEYERAA